MFLSTTVVFGHLRVSGADIHNSTQTPSTTVCKFVNAPMMKNSNFSNSVVHNHYMSHSNVSSMNISIEKCFIKRKIYTVTNEHAIFDINDSNGNKQLSQMFCEYLIGGTFVLSI